MEVLISLAFFSLISVLLFQSLLTQYRALDRVENAIETSLDDAVERQLLRRILSQTIAGWSNQPETQFSGNSNSINGLTTSNLSSATSDLVTFRLDIIPTADGVELAIMIDDVVLSPVELPEGAEFEYYGYDQKWRTDWPPAQDDVFFSTSDEAALRIHPLPDHIRLTSVDRSILLSASIAQRQALPLRMADVLSSP